MTVGWVGDSRAYWIPDDREGAEPYRLTEDDSWAARMVAAGLMGEAEAYADARAHAITGWLGADAEEVEPHTAAFTPHVPGVLLICTDGLWNYAEAATSLADLVRADARTDPLRAARALVSFAIAAGGHDNITVAVLPVLPVAVEDPRPRTPTPCLTFRCSRRCPRCRPPCPASSPSDSSSGNPLHHPQTNQELSAMASLTKSNLPGSPPTSSRTSTSPRAPARSTRSSPSPPPAAAPPAAVRSARWTPSPRRAATRPW